MFGLTLTLGCATAPMATGARVDGGLQPDVVSDPRTDVGATDTLVVATSPEDVMRAAEDRKSVV